MKIHVKANPLANFAACHQINTSRVTHELRSVEQFESVREEWKCKACKRSLIRLARLRMGAEGKIRPLK